MSNEKRKNTVDGKNQINKYVFFEGKENGSPCIMIVGNSITRHAPKEDIGWFGDWGMAASSKERDYVHIIISKFTEKYPDAFFCIVQGAVWETTYKTCEYEEYFSGTMDFKPDVIINTLSENVSGEDFEEDIFIDSLISLNKYLSGGNANVKVIKSTSFFGYTEINAAIEKFSEKTGSILVPIGDIYADDENLALGLFEHKGIQIHPGDKGMERLAERYLEKLFEIV